jgi:hypothetical protein
MKPKNFYKTILLIVTSFFVFACQSESPVSQVDEFNSLNSSGVISEKVQAPGELSEQERDGLIYMRLEEKLARDVYITFGDLYSYTAFLNIQTSEQNHMDAMKRLIDKYNIEDPVTTDSVGVFSNPDFQQLYDQYITQGSVSLYDALLAGKAIEELDIADLGNQLTFVDNQDIIRVYQNLFSASQNHLASFIKCLNAQTVLVERY